MRQLRCDLAYENACVQRCKAEPCVADLVRLRQYITQVKRAANFRMRYESMPQCWWVLPPAGQRGRSQTKDGARQHFVRSVVSDSGRRSTLAVEAARLAEAVEAGGWLAVLLHEAFHEDLDLKQWEKVVEARSRAYVTDTRLSTTTCRRTQPPHPRTSGWQLRETQCPREVD